MRTTAKAFTDDDGERDDTDRQNPKSRRKSGRPEGTRAPNGESSIYFSDADGRWHGWVTVGIKDDGKPDRRHRSAKSETALRRKVRELEKERDEGAVREAGTRWKLGKWLAHWAEEISAPTVRDTSADAYRSAVYKHLIPGLGAHWLDRVQPEHFERLYKKMREAGHKPGNIHQVHRTARVALNEAVRRRYLGRNPVPLAKYPRLEEDEIEPYTLEEVQRILAAVAHRRNSARWAVALVLGLRQGEVLGLRWDDVDLTMAALRTRETRLRPKYRHGCEPDGSCGRKPGYCPQKVNTRKTTGPVKSRSGRRPMGIPAPLVRLLEAQREAQDKERAEAGDLWHDTGYVFTTQLGEAVNPNTDFHEWKDVLGQAGVRDGRLHDARHTAATLLLILEVTDRTTQGLMGWSDPSMPARYQHLVKRVRDDVAKRQGDLVWNVPAEPPEPPNATENATEDRED